MADIQGETPVVQDTTPTSQPTPSDATEEHFDEARAMDLIKKLRDEVKALKGKAKKADDYEAAEQQRKDAELSEVDKLRKKLSETEAALTARTREALQRDVAARVGIPASLASRLAGDTAEDMEKDAKAILDEIQKVAKPAAPALGATNPGSSASAQETTAQKKARLMGNRVNIWGE